MELRIGCNVDVAIVVKLKTGCALSALATGKTDATTSRKKKFFAE